MSASAATVAFAFAVAVASPTRTTQSRVRQQETDTSRTLRQRRHQQHQEGPRSITGRGETFSSGRRERNRVLCRATPNGNTPGTNIGLGPLAGIYDAVGDWLVAHPAPQWLVNSPLKTRVTELLAGTLDSEYDLDTSVEEVKRLIASDDVVVFSATYCPFSAAAKAALRAEGVPFKAIEWNKTPGGAGFAPALATFTGRSSIPHIFIGGESIGGCNDGTPGIR